VASLNFRSGVDDGEVTSVPNEECGLELRSDSGGVVGTELIFECRAFSEVELVETSLVSCDGSEGAL